MLWGALGCGCLTNLRVGLAPPDPQQPIDCWILAICMAGVLFCRAGVLLYVAGVVFGGQQACPKGVPGGPG